MIYPVPGFPIYESQIVANGARAGADLSARGARLRVRSGGARSEDHAEDAAAHPQHAAQSDRRHAARRRSRRDRRDPARAIRRSGCSPTRSTRGSSTTARFDSLATRPGMLERTIISRRRVEDLGDDRLAHRLSSPTARSRRCSRAGSPTPNRARRRSRSGRRSRRSPARRTRPTRCARASSSAAT